MIVTEVSLSVYRVELTEPEVQAFMVIAAGSPKLDLSSVSDTMAYVLKYCTDRCYLVIKEPEIDGNSRTT